MTEDKVDTSPTVEPTGDPPEPTVDTPPNPYDGKTLEELQAILKEKETMIGKQSGEIGELRTKSSELENQVAYRQQFGTQQEPNPFDTQIGNVEEPKPGTQDEVPPEFWTNPREQWKKWNQEERVKEQQELQKKDTEIRKSIFQAKPFIEQAKKEAPHLFSGVSDQELDSALYNGLANNLVSPHGLGDTKTYKQAAMWIQGEKTNYGFNPASPSSPVPPTVTEPYVGNKLPADATKTPLEFDALGTEFLKHRPKGMTEEEFKDKVRVTQKEGR